MTPEVIDWLDELSHEDALECFKACCGSKSWYTAMETGRPFNRPEALTAAADAYLDALSDSDWLEAFSCHPRIGDLDSLRMKYAGNTQWSRGEQGGIDQANEAVLAELSKLNRDYFERFGFIFIVCASGKSAAEMLGLLKDRINNDRAAEIAIAAEEQRKITHLRLEKLETS